MEFILSVKSPINETVKGIISGSEFSGESSHTTQVSFP